MEEFFTAVPGAKLGSMYQILDAFVAAGVACVENEFEDQWQLLVGKNQEDILRLTIDDSEDVTSITWDMGEFDPETMEAIPEVLAQFGLQGDEDEDLSDLGL